MRRLGAVGRALFLIVGIGALVAIAAFWAWHKWEQHQTVSASSIAREAGADSCSDTGYKIINRLDGSNDEIFECSFVGAADKCVAREHGITRDVTAEAKLLFKGTLGTDPPVCASE